VRLFHFDKLTKAASHALKFGIDTMGDKWVFNFVNRGHRWNTLLENILRDQTSEIKSDYYERF